MAAMNVKELRAILKRAPDNAEVSLFFSSEDGKRYHVERATYMDYQVVLETGQEIER